MNDFRKTILLVDDDPDDFELFSELFKEHDKGLSLRHVKNGNEALQLLRSIRNLPQLILLDMNMPLLDGKQTLTYIKKEDRFSEIPVVMLTTSSSETDKLYCKKLNVEMYAKPSGIMDMEALVKKLVEMIN